MTARPSPVSPTPQDHHHDVSRAWRPSDSSTSPRSSTGRPSTVPRTSAGDLRVQIGPVVHSHGVPVTTDRSSTPRTATRDGVAVTGPSRRNVRSCRRSPSHTAHHAERAGPTRATAAQSMSSGPNAPIQVHRLEARSID